MNKKEIVLFQEFHNFNKMNEENLIGILNDNRKTKRGEQYQFKAIKKSKAYQKRMPLSTYEDYRGKNDSCYPSYCTLVTSGTTGVSKKIILTKKALEQYHSYIYQMPYLLAGIKKGKTLHTSVFHYEEEETILSSAYYHYFIETGEIQWNDFIDHKFLFSDEKFCIPYVKLRVALAYEELMSIQSIYLYEIYVLFDYLDKNWQPILKDMENNQISISLPESISNELKKITCSKRRIQYLQEQFSYYKGIPPLKQIWKKFTFISGIGQKDSLYTLKLKELLLDLPIYYFAYALSECICGIALDFNEDEYALLPRSAFYEFMNEKGEFFLPNEIVVGETYELIVTTFNGLYRYRTNDLLKITGFEGESPKFRVLGRKNLQLNISGERVDEQTLQLVLMHCLQILHINYANFSIGIDTKSVPGKYIIFTNLSGIIHKKFAVLFDQELIRLNPNYAKLRSKGYIQEPDLIYRDMEKRGKGHLKPKLIINKEEMEVILNEEKPF